MFKVVLFVDLEECVETFGDVRPVIWLKSEEQNTSKTHKTSCDLDPSILLINASRVYLYSHFRSGVLAIKATRCESC